MPPLPTCLQDLPPKWAHFCLGVERFMARDLQVELHGSRLVVAVSGGADSTALLLILHYLAPRLQCQLSPVHLDHGIREESADEAQHVARLCEQLGCPCVLERREVPQLAAERGMGLEEAGRLARLELLERECATAPPSATVWAVTGHHLDDLAEDQLMRRLRGTGWPGLGGMRAVASEKRLLRPLLLTPKRQLIEFLQELGVAWCEDLSNQDPAFLRNRVRHELLPLMLRENPAHLETAAALWRQARLDQDYWDIEVARLMQQVRTHEDGSLLLPAKALQNVHTALRLRVFKACLESLGAGQPLAEALFQLDAAWKAGRVGATLQFPGGKEAHVSQRGILFQLSAPG